MYEYKKFKVSICEAKNFIRKSEQFGWECIPCKKTIGPLACLNLDKKDDRADTPTICTQNHKSFNATVNCVKADSAALTSRNTDSATARRNFASVGLPDGKTICPDLGTPAAESSDEIRSTAFFSERKHNTIRILLRRDLSDPLCAQLKVLEEKIQGIRYPHMPKKPKKYIIPVAFALLAAAAALISVTVAIAYAAPPKSFLIIAICLFALCIFFPLTASAKKRYPAKLQRYRQAMQKFDDDCNAVAKRENALIRQARLLDDERRMQNESHTL